MVPFSVLFSEHRGYFPEDKAVGAYKLNTYLHSIAENENKRSSISTPPIYLYGMHMDKYTFTNSTKQSPLGEIHRHLTNGKILHSYGTQEFITTFTRA